ncbi:MAG TPA: GAF domain-containing protein [Streptosporangiaceae bacterium]|nr:GAF domain-containing protein [Streptosporangiaceae bacterium]
MAWKRGFPAGVLAVRIGADAVISQVAGDDGAPPPGRRGPDLAGLAVFTLDPAGRVGSWSVTAERLFGRPASEVAGRDVCEVLLAGGGQRGLVGQGLAEVAAGRIWAATLVMATGGGDDRVSMHWEPLAGPGSGVLVIARIAAQRPGPDLLREAAARIGTTLDLPRTAREFADVAVPAFADAAAIFVSERLLAADEPGAQGPGPAAVIRRLAARLAGQPAAVSDSLLHPGEVFVFGAGSPSFRAMTTGSPVMTGHLDDETAERLARRPGGRHVTSRYTSFLAVPLEARGLMLGCATFARTAGSPRFSTADVAMAGELAARAAVCIDNARLYHRERRAAFALQQGLLPAEPRAPAAVEVAHRYLPVGASVVGGDWHDIVALPGGGAAHRVRRAGRGRLADAPAPAGGPRRAQRRRQGLAAATPGAAPAGHLLGQTLLRPQGAAAAQQLHLVHGLGSGVRAAGREGPRARLAGLRDRGRP